MMHIWPDIAGMLVTPNEESWDSVQRPIFDFDSIIAGLKFYTSLHVLRRPSIHPIIEIFKKEVTSFA